MADKTIGTLPKIENLSDDSRIPVEQMGAAGHLTGAQLKQYVVDAAEQTVETATAEANAAAAAANRSAQEASEAAETAAQNAVVAAEERLSGYTDSAREAKAKAETAAAEAANIVDGLDIAAVYSAIAMKGDNLEFDENEEKLYLTSNGTRISDGITIVTSGGGGGGPTNNAVMTLTNTTGWIYKSISSGASCPISFNWSSLENDISTGPGVLKVIVNNIVKHQSSVEQGDVPLDIGGYLNTGSNNVRINVSDVYGNGRTIALNVTTVALALTSDFDASIPRTGAFEFGYTPVGAATKTVHILVDGNEIGTEVVTASNRRQPYTIPAQSHGSHTIECYFTAEIDGETVPSNRLYFDVPCLEEGNTKPIITSEFHATEAEQFDSIVIPYTVYDPSGMTATVSLAANGKEVTSLTVDRTKQSWTYRADESGVLKLTITCGDTVKPFDLTVAASSIKVEAETKNLSLHLSSYGRSNNEADPGVWTSGDVAAEFRNFNFTSDGWQPDSDGITALRVSGDARLEIPLNLFEQDFRDTGKTIEIEFASRNVLDYDAVIATCWSGDRGLRITAQQAGLKSEQSAVDTRYKEDDHLRLGFVIEKKSGNRLIISYINGIISGMVRYSEDDDFSQAAPVGITLGSNDCTIDLYNIRVYDNDLTRHQMLDNWIADTQSGAERADRYNRNDIFDGNDLISPNTLKSEQRYMVLVCPVLPTYKEDVKICSGYYVDNVNPERSFTFENAEIDVQGTSSQFYYVKNFKIKFKGGFTRNGTTNATYAMNANAVPVNTFTFKADVASSEGANNVVLAELYNELCPVKIPAQEADPRVRQTIEGHPIVMFHDSGDGPYFLGKYNFNNDKGTAEVFGFADGDESWEIKENGNAQVSFKTSDFTNWQTSFEARYPKDNTNITRLREFVAWVASTDTTVAGLTEAQKTARLNKFKDELPDHADVDDAIFYYLFTLIFLGIDQREKNAFPTYNAEMAKWLWLYYDADSSLGTDNKGNLTFEYWMEDIDHTAAGDPVYNGQNNVFWSNLRVCFPDKIRDEYRRLRTELGADGKPLLSYDRVNGLFESHQSQWCEAIYNEDAWRKAIEPLEKVGDPQYLPMQQGKKEQHFKHWMYNRFRYLDSKFETGAALDEENRIMMRAHAQGNISLTSYINMYGQVYYNSERVEHRMVRDQAQPFEWGAVGAEDAVIGVNSAPMITSLGDLSPLMLEYCHIQYASHLTELKVGDADEDYENDNLVALTLGNNKLLRKLDARNCTALAQSVDASGCTNIEEVYFDNTAITGCKLPNGGILKKLHLPETITNLTIQNQTKLTEFVLPGYSNITTLRLENVSPAIPMKDILDVIPANSRVRLIGFNWSFNSAADILAFYDRLDTMRGLNESGGNENKPQMSGTVFVDSLTGDELAEMKTRYPGIKVTYNNISLKVYYKNWDGTLLYTADCNQGGNAIDPVATGLIDAPTREADEDAMYQYAGWVELPTNIQENVDVVAKYTPLYRVRFYSEGSIVNTQWIQTGLDAVEPVGAGYISVPTKAATAQYTYAFNDWDGSLTNVTAPRDVNAVFTATVRTYTVTWMNGSTTLETDTNVPYGTVPTYNGADPVYTGADAEDYEWNGWSPAVVAVTGNATYTAAFKYSGYIYTKMINRSISGEYVNDTVTSIGKYAFRSCSALTTANFPVATSIGNSAFQDCSNLTTADFPVATSIGGNAFRSCSALTTANFPAAPRISSYAFQDCSNLTTADFPVATSIGEGAFSGCSKLSVLILRSETMCTLDITSAFNSTPIKSGTGYIYVPAALLDSYKANSTWNTFANQFRALEDYPEITGGETV